MLFPRCTQRFALAKASAKEQKKAPNRVPFLLQQVDKPTWRKTHDILKSMGRQ